MMAKASLEASKKNSSGSDKEGRSPRLQAQLHNQKSNPPQSKQELLDAELLQQQQKKVEVNRVAESVGQEEARVERKVLDDRYLLLKTIGHGRYAK